MPLIYKLRLQNYILFITRKNFFTKKTQTRLSLSLFQKKGMPYCPPFLKALGPTEKIKDYSEKKAFCFFTK